MHAKTRVSCVICVTPLRRLNLRMTLKAPDDAVLRHPTVSSRFEHRKNSENRPKKRVENECGGARQVWNSQVLGRSPGASQRLPEDDADLAGSFCYLGTVRNLFPKR